MGATGGSCLLQALPAPGGFLEEGHLGQLLGVSQGLEKMREGRGQGWLGWS